MARGVGPRLTFAQQEEMGERYIAGENIVDLVAAFGVDRKTLSNVRKRLGIARRPWTIRGSDHWAFKSGRMVDSQGYVWVLVAPDDPFASMRVGGYVAEHRLVMARSLGRPLLYSETVHHKNLNRSDNALTNLQLRRGRHGVGAVFTCGDCGSHNIVPQEIGD